MFRLSCIALFASVALLSVQLTWAATNPEQAQLQRCQSYKDKIELYTALRRRGASASQMDTWRRQRNEFKERFGAEDCKRYHRKLT